MNAEDRRAETGQKVLIVGAGPTGLVLALWLTRLGVSVRIVDRTDRPGTTSRALAVSARTLEFYRQLGLAGSLVDRGVQVAGVNLWANSSRVARLPLGVMGEGLTPYPFALIYPQDEHERVLVDALAALGVHVERRTELVRFEQHTDGVRATLRHADGSEEQIDTPYLAGCDGARSTVRETLGVGFPGGTYSGVFFVADVNGTGPATNGEIHVDFTKSDFLAVFPLKGEGRVRLVGRVDAPTGDGLEPGATTFEDVRGRVSSHLGLTIGTVNWFSTYHVHHRVASRFRDGRVFLLGDAAHVHSPVGGQGMNTGIGDAVNLSWKLASVLHGETDAALLDSYEPERIAFARRLVRTTDRLFTLVSARGGFARFVRTRVFPYVAAGLFRFSSWRRFLFRTLSQLIVRYPESRLSEGSAGSVRGGDRLPWVELSPDADNFAPLQALTWQVHVYGEPSAGLADECQRLGLTLVVYGWRPEMKQAGLASGAIYLVRPDGYVALADAGGSPPRLAAYLARLRRQPVRSS